MVSLATESSRLHIIVYRTLSDGTIYLFMVKNDVVTHNLRTVVFLTGTTLMRAILDSHSMVRCGEETYIIPIILGIREQWSRQEDFQRRVDRWSNGKVTSELMKSAYAAFLSEVRSIMSLIHNTLCLRRIMLYAFLFFPPQPLETMNAFCSGAFYLLYKKKIQHRIINKKIVNQTINCRRSSMYRRNHC